MSAMPATPATPARLRLSANEAQAYRQLARGACQRGVSLAGTPWQLTLEPRVGAAPRWGPTGWMLRLQWSGGQFALLVPPLAPQLWLRARFPELDLPQLPPAYAAAVLEDALSEALTALEALGRDRVRLDGLGPADAAPPAGLEHHLALTLCSASQVLHATLLADSLGLLLLAGALGTTAQAPNPVDPQSVPVVLQALIGRSTLSARELQQLQVRSVILLEHASITPDGELWLRVHDSGVRVRWDATQCVVTRTLTPIESPMTSTETETLSTGAPVAIEAIPIRLDFDLGTLRMTLGALRGLQLGQVLELGQPLEQAVQVRANGALVGRGELVEVAGRLGVMLTEWVGPQA